MGPDDSRGRDDGSLPLECSPQQQNKCLEICLVNVAGLEAIELPFGFLPQSRTFAERAPGTQPNRPDSECVTTIVGPIRSSRATSAKLLLIVKYKKQYSRQEPEQPTYP